MKLPIIRTLLGLWLILPGALAVPYAVYAVVDWWPSDDRIPVFEDLLPLRAHLAIECIAALGAVLLRAFDLVVLVSNRCTRIRRSRVWFVVRLGSMYSPVFVRSMLPWEDPYDGGGSPTAVLLGLMFIGAACTIAFALPAIVLCIDDIPRTPR